MVYEGNIRFGRYVILFKLIKRTIIKYKGAIYNFEVNNKNRIPMVNR